MAEKTCVLIVDDDTNMRTTLADILVEKGYKVIEAAGGEEAFDKLNKERVNLVILDVVLPKKDGYQVYKSLRKNKATSQLPVIMISGKKPLYEMVAETNKEAFCYVVKGGDPNELINAVRVALEGHLKSKK